MSESYFPYETSRATKVNAMVILQSINGYLLLRVISGLTIIIILKSNPDAFSFPDTYRLTEISYDEAQYLGLVTISTLGYGDIIPLAPIARSATTLMTVLGQLYIAIISALLAGKFSSMRK